MTSELTFLPSIRRGLIQAVSTIDRGGPLQSGASLNAWVSVEGRRADMPVRLLGPDAVIGIAPQQILRAEPRPDSSDVEPNYFPFVELATPDLPWMLTPARADARGRLRPWLVLVTVREQEGVTLLARPGAPLPVLSTPVGELPDLSEAWAWAHVQSAVGLDEIERALERQTGEVVARLVCPRRLSPHNAWIACIVPAFESGRLLGLGESPVRGAPLAPAWDNASAVQVELPVYYSWRFSTGAAGDFEALCRRLQPDEEGADLGRHPLEIADPGLITPAERSVLVDMQGALETPGARSRVWPPAHRLTFEREIKTLLDAGAARAVLHDTAADPIVTPPFYAAAYGGARELPADGWLRELNADPVLRAAAGLGAAAVRADQEALVAAAWNQADDIRAANRALNQARLGAEVAGSLARRASLLADADLLQLSAPLHAWLRTGTSNVRATLADSELPAGLISAAYLRQTRPSSTLARRWRTLAAADSNSRRLALDHVTSNLEATRVLADRTPLAFAQYGTLAGALTSDPTLSDPGPAPELGEPSAPLASEVSDLLDRIEGRQPGPRKPRPWLLAQVQQLTAAGRGAERAHVRQPMAAVPNVSGIAGSVRAALDPMASIRSSLEQRIPALRALLTAAPVPCRLALAPIFEDPLSEDLIRLGVEWMLPGVRRIARNRVRLLAVNPEFVVAMLVGANIELARELSWRDYPCDPQATFFKRFWSHSGDPQPNDIGELRGWRGELSIAENLAADGGSMTRASTVIVLRGDLVRRYPSAHYFLQAADSGGDPSGAALEASFCGLLAADTLFLGFEREPAEVRGDPGYFLAIEEQPGAPRLGLDRERKRDFEELPHSWDALSWGHFAGSAQELALLTHARADSPRLSVLEPIDGITWGRNSAHLARACWQRPFRMYIHARTLV